VIEQERKVRSTLIQGIQAGEKVGLLKNVTHELPASQHNILQSAERMHVNAY
jgi:hypothetical protein